MKTVDHGCESPNRDSGAEPNFEKNRRGTRQMLQRAPCWRSLPPPSVVFTLFFIYFFLSQRLSPTIPTCLPREKRIAEGSQPHFHNKFVSSRDDGPPNAAHNKMAEGDEGEVEGGGCRRGGDECLDLN